ncbi:MAG: protein kinase domain-containing protein, partial [Planctomycetota bacterium]
RANEDALGMLKQLPLPDVVDGVESSSSANVTLPLRGREAQRATAFPGLPSDSFRGYTIVREAHRGGQGVVYQAIQKGTKRKVAIKVMKEGPFAGPTDKARFEREVQVLGQLNHPNIVAIHDSGSAAGSFYYVMDYVSGRPLDVHMASDHRSIDDTLRLFAKICEAVSAAHLRGVIHRDLKPSNIRIDAEGKPHVLDFGLAKVATGTVTNASQPQVMTMTGQFVGSLPWASPEQAEGAPGKIDVRTDVYSLGVILYQMLTGKFPYAVVGNMRDVLDRIMKAEPARPSTVRKQINDEVETIVLKCLAKERERRYQTAGELGRDVVRYLAGEPIEAKRDSAMYVLRKQVGKHRVPLGVAAGFLLLLIGSSVALMVQTTHVAREAEAAQEINRFFNDMLATVDPMRVRSLSGFAPEGYTTPAAEPGGFGREVSVADMMRMASADTEQRFVGKPELEAGANETIGMTLQSLWLFQEAERHLQVALDIRSTTFGQDDPETLRSKMQLAYTWWDGLKGHTDEAEDLARSAYEGMKAHYGREDPKALTAGRVLACVLTERARYRESDRIFEETLAAQRRTLGDDHRDTVTTMLNWIHSSFWQGKFARGYRLVSEAYDISHRTFGLDDSLTIRVQHYVGVWDLIVLRQHDIAAERFQECLAACQRVLGHDHPFTYLTKRFLGQSVRAKGRLHEAEQLYREALQGMQETYGEEQRPALYTMGLYLAPLLAAQGEFEEAVELSQRALDISYRIRGEFDHQTIFQMKTHYRLLLRAGRKTQAREVAEELAKVGRELVTRSEASAPALYLYAGFLLHPPFKDLRDRAGAVEAARRAVEMTDHEAPWLLSSLARAYRASGDLDQAIEAQQEALAAFPQVESFPRTGYEIRLASMLKQRGDTSAAEAVLRDAVSRTRQSHGDEQAELVKRMLDLAFVLLEGHYGKVDGLWLDIVQAQQGKPPHEWDDSPFAASNSDDNALTAIVSKLGQAGRHADAETVLRAYRQVQEVALPQRSWRIAYTRSLLGAALAGQNRFEEAESLLLDAHDQLQDHPDAPVDRVNETIERIAKLYESWGKPDAAAEWQATLSAAAVATEEQRGD